MERGRGRKKEGNVEEKGLWVIKANGRRNDVITIVNSRYSWQ